MKVDPCDDSSAFLRREREIQAGLLALSYHVIPLAFTRCPTNNGAKFSELNKPLSLSLSHFVIGTENRLRQATWANRKQRQKGAEGGGGHQQLR
jgi:hypothetical protein